MWNDIIPLLGMQHVNTATWATRVSVRDWWTNNIHTRVGSPKALASLMMLISWEIWTERNARVFRNTAVPSMVLISKIKEKVSFLGFGRCETVGYCNAARVVLSFIIAALRLCSKACFLFNEMANLLPCFKK